MIPTNVRTLGLTIAVLVPQTVEEYDTLAKKVGACLESANANTIYRGVLAEFRSLFTETVEKETGIERKTKPTGKFVKDAEGKDTDEAILVYDETEAEYFDRVIAQTGKVREAFQATANEVAAAIAFDPSSRERTPSGPKKTAKAYLDIADQIIAAGKSDSAAQKLTAQLGLTVEPTRESLGAAIAEDQRRKRAALANEYAG